jgi:hypothetical protein
MAAAGKWKRYNKFGLWVADGTFDLDADTFKIALYTSASNANTLTNSVLADLTNEVANANGYTTGGLTLGTLSWTEAAGVGTFDFTVDPVWTANGGSITARFAAIYKSGTANAHVNPLVAVSLLDTTPADVTATDTNTFTVQLNASGVFTLSAGQVD